MVTNCNKGEHTNIHAHIFFSNYLHSFQWVYCFKEFTVSFISLIIIILILFPKNICYCKHSLSFSGFWVTSIFIDGFEVEIQWQIYFTIFLYSFQDFRKFMLPWFPEIWKHEVVTKHCYPIFRLRLMPKNNYDNICWIIHIFRNWSYSNANGGYKLVVRKQTKNIWKCPICVSIIYFDRTGYKSSENNQKKPVENGFIRFSKKCGSISPSFG